MSDLFFNQHNFMDDFDFFSYDSQEAPQADYVVGTPEPSPLVEPISNKIKGYFCPATNIFYIVDT